MYGEQAVSPHVGEPNPAGPVLWLPVKLSQARGRQLQRWVHFVIWTDFEKFSTGR